MTVPPLVTVSVSVDGKLLVAAQPVTVKEATVDAAIRAAHAAYFSGGESGYTAGIDPTWNMFLITQCWGVPVTPYVMINGAVLGSAAIQTTPDATPIAPGTT
jgi:roadblock/LC7 domain-containing protein